MYGVGIITYSVIANIIMSFFSDKFATSENILTVCILSALGFGIFKLSRTAAILALLFYLLDKGFTIYNTGKIPALYILYCLFYIHAVRGTFAYYKFNKLSKDKPCP